jgi:hypothetical protein
MEKKRAYSREISIQYSKTGILSGILEVLISWHMVTNFSYIVLQNMHNSFGPPT